jgi:hypothetical protein
MSFDQSSLSDDNLKDLPDELAEDGVEVLQQAGA